MRRIMRCMRARGLRRRHNRKNSTAIQTERAEQAKHARAGHKHETNALHSEI